MKLALKHDCSVFAGKCWHTRGCLVPVCYAAMASTHDAWWILQKEGRNAFAERNIRMRMWIFRLNVPDLHGA